MRKSQFTDERFVVEVHLIKGPDPTLACRPRVGDTPIRLRLDRPVQASGVALSGVSTRYRTIQFVNVW